MIQEANSTTHFTFHNFPDLKAFKVPKEGIETWHDLKYQLDEKFNIKFQCMDIVINNRKVFYDDNTLMEDIDIRKTDFCICLLRHRYNNEKQTLAYEKQVKENIVKNDNRIKSALNEPQNKKALALIKNNASLSTLYKDLIKQYSKWQCLIAIKDHPNNYQRIRQDLSTGQSRKKLLHKIYKEERKYIDQFLDTQDMKELKSQVFDHKKDAKIYGQIIWKLYEKYPRFREVEINHQEYIQLKLLGKTLYQVPIKASVKLVFDKVSQNKKIKVLGQKQYGQFKNKHIKRKQERQINEAFDISGNNPEKAEMLIQKGSFNPNLNYYMTLKKKARLNLVLQFFSKPDFQPIRQSLKGNKPKAEAFVSFIQSQQKNNIVLSKSIKKYKNYIVAILTSINCDSQEKLQNENLIFQKQPPLEQQKKMIRKVEEIVDKDLVNELIKLKYEQKIAESIVRASENNIDKAYPYMYLNSVPLKYDFCVGNQIKEQIFLQKQFKKQKELLNQLKDEKQELIWLGSIKQKSPFLFDLIIRNKAFFDHLIKGSSQKISSQIKQSKKK